MYSSYSLTMVYNCISTTKIHFIYLLKLQLSTNQKLSAAIKSNGATVYLSRDTERLSRKGRPKKWNAVEDFVVLRVKKSWETGAPLTPEQLHQMVIEHLKNSPNEQAAKHFIHGKKNTTNRYIQRVLARNQYSVRKMTISQSVPVDWRTKAEENALRIRSKFKEEKVDVVINADETFLLFHPLGERLIAPKGVKRVGTAMQVDNEKWGATVMIACEYKTSSIIPPMVIFTGVYCAKLMAHWANFDKAKVIFNESHWMTNNAAIIYITHLMNIFRGKTIGLIWDKHSSHYSEEVMQFINKSNHDTTTGTKLILELVDEGLTPIIQVPDVAVNKNFKAGVKQKYHQYRSELPLTIGKKVTVSREKVIEFILETINDINNHNDDNQYIRDAFRKCGLNPWSKEQSDKAFREHLDKLESNSILRAMISNQTALTLSD